MFHSKGSAHISGTNFFGPFKNHPLHIGSFNTPISEEMVQYVDIVQFKYAYHVSTRNMKWAHIRISCLDAEVCRYHMINYLLF